MLEDAALQRYRIDVADNRHARRVRTQVQVLRRITVAILVLCAIAAILLTFPSARALGASLLASAGLISIVAGLAAQSSLANVFAGLQLAFTDAIRVDDVVVVADEWGRIEEITLTYVVVHVWDDRRLILPSTYFTTTPFENWTRRAADLLGTVELDVDWEVPVEAMRAELTRLLQDTDLWDRRVGILQVTDAVGGHGPRPRAGQRGRRPHAVRPALLRPRGARRLAAARGAAEPAEDPVGGHAARAADGPPRRRPPGLRADARPARAGRVVPGRHADHHHRRAGRPAVHRAASTRWSGRGTSPGPGRTSSTSASSPPRSTGRGGSPDPSPSRRSCWSTGWCSSSPARDGTGRA